MLNLHSTYFWAVQCISIYFIVSLRSYNFSDFRMLQMRSEWTVCLQGLMKFQGISPQRVQCTQETRIFIKPV